MLITSKVINRFKLNIINLDIADTEREIQAPAIHRNGLELSGSFRSTSNKTHVIGWGTKERNFLREFNKDERIEIIRRVFSDKTPIVLLSVGFEDSQEIVASIHEVCNEYKIPLAITHQHRSDLVMTIGWYIVKYLAPTSEVHGSLIEVNGIGVLIMGKSGIGKSEAVLELIQKGHRFISDDTVVLKRIGLDFVGEGAPLTKDFLEARGIGLIDIPRIYGLQSIANSVKVSLAIELLPAEKLNDVDRLGDSKLSFDVLGGSIKKTQIPVENGRTLSALIEAAVNVYIAKIHGHDPLKIIAKRRDI